MRFWSASRVPICDMLSNFQLKTFHFQRTCGTVSSCQAVSGPSKLVQALGSWTIASWVILFPVARATKTNRSYRSHTRFYLPRQLPSTDSADTSNANYAPSIFLGNTADFDYDACASIVSKDEVAFDAFYARFKEPDIAKVLGEDEDKFLWRQKLIVAVAGVPCVSLQPQSA